MKILVVNNNTEHLQAILTSLAGHEVEIQKYRPGIQFNDSSKDLVILSGGGGEGLEIIDKVTRRGKLWYQDEMNFVRQTNTPVLGICMGFEVIVNTFGGKIYHQPDLIHGFRGIHLNDNGKKLFKESNLKQVESHYWITPEVSDKELEILAKSETGIEMVRHKSKRILGMQFHPEEGGTLNLKQLLHTV